MKLASNILAIYFLLMGLFPNGELCELQKIPALYGHFLEHRQADGDSFLEFIYEDYLSDVGDKENHHGKDSSQEMPLQHHTAQSHCCNLMPLGLCNCNLYRPNGEKIKGYKDYNFQYSFLYLESIFQPLKA